MDDFRAAIELALTKIKALRPEPGRYRGTFIAKVAIDMTVGRDYEAEVPVAVPWRALFTLAASKLNDATLDMIVRDALEMGEDNLPPDLSDMAKRVQKAVKKIQGQTLRTCRGAVRGSAIVVDVLDQQVTQDPL